MAVNDETAAYLEELGITEDQLYQEGQQEIDQQLDLQAEVVQTFWSASSPEDTGDYKSDFEIRRMKDPDGRPTRRIVNQSPYAHIIEYGSEDTPEFAPRAKTATHFKCEGTYTVQDAQEA